MPHRNIHISRCVCFVFPSCGVIQLAYMNPMELKLTIQLGTPCSQITSFQGFPKGCWLRLAFEALPTIPVIPTMRKLFFVESLHHHPGRNKKNFKQVSMASILCQKQRCPCAFFGSKWSMGGRNRAQHHSSLPTWIPQDLGLQWQHTSGSKNNSIWLSIPAFFDNIDYLNLQSSPQTGHLRCQAKSPPQTGTWQPTSIGGIMWFFLAPSVAMSSKNDVHESKPSQQLVQWIQFTPVLGK